MNRAILCAAVALAFFVGTRLHPTPTPTPAPTPVPAPKPVPRPPVIRPIPELTPLADAMSADDRQALAEAYQIISRSIAANPIDDPVFPTTGAVREAHRAALLCVWRGVLGNTPGKYPGLREGLEGAIGKVLGTDDVLLTPTIQQQAAKVFMDISDTLR